uniref:Uncharacterized protein LOC111102126 n=1 Tax=Crassostrea virginica TaxID=6565 RepID=A0A8B8AKC6_CRAVI|nr:uncharacterized protein LOC111102126 [Crassostrea virginica]
MPNTKITKSKQPDSCPFCNKAIDEPWQDHVILCSGQRFKCLTCGARFKKNSYLLKHMKRHEPSSTTTSPVKKLKRSMSTRDGGTPVLAIPVGTVQQPLSTDVSLGDQSDWEKQDPGDLDDVIGSCSDSETEDSVEVESKRKSTDELELGRIIRKRTEPILFTGPKPKSLEVCREAAKEDGIKEKSVVNVSTQTEPLLFLHSTKKITTKWENGVKIKTIEKKKCLNLN